MSHYLLDARTATSHFPGIGRYVRNLTAEIVPQLAPEERLSVLWNPSDPGGWNPSALAGARVQLVPAPVSPFRPAQQWRIPRLLGQLRTAGCSAYHSAYYLMPYRPGLPTLLTFYDVIPLRYPATVSAQARLFYRFATGLALRASQRVIAISEAARQDLLRYFPVPAPKVRAVPLAADPRFRPQPTGELARVRAKYDLPEQFVFYLGINKPHKNLVRLIDAYAGLAGRSVPPLVIAGAWDARYPQTRQRAAQAQGDDPALADVFRFLGPVEDGDLPGLYAAATVFVFPSLYEGFGLPVLEAMACGTPVACSETSSLPEIAGQAGRLFDPLDVKAIGEALAELLANERLRERLAQRGLAQAGTFSWRRTAQETLACYRELLGG